MFKHSFVPNPKNTRMKDVRDFKKARNDFKDKPSNNLEYLYKQRFSWINDYININDYGIDIGSGSGIIKSYIKTKNYLLTDINNNEWLDIKNMDAMDTHLASNSFDFVTAINVLHHMAYPVRFLKEMYRILKPGGRLIIIDPNASFMLCLFMRITKHEGYSFEPNIFDETLALNDPQDPASANCAISNLLFDNRNKFISNIPFFKIIMDTHTEFGIFLNSGGVNSKIFYFPLPKMFLRALHKIDELLIRISPEIFSLLRNIVLKKCD